MDEIGSRSRDIHNLTELQHDILHRSRPQLLGEQCLNVLGTNTTRRQLVAIS